MNHVTIRRLSLSLALCLAVGAWSLATRAQSPTLASRLDALRTSAKVPAVGGAVFQSGRMLEMAVVGVRKQGDPTPVTVGDLWHIGSLTKSFTSALVGLAVERGQFTWTTTLGELLGAERARKFAPATVENVLSHRAGLPPNVQPALMMALAQSPDPLPQQRQRVIDAVLAGEPASAPGERYQYSNVDYILMGAILEARAGKPWEELVRSQVLVPLGLTSAGFGAPGTPDTVSQPRGHRALPSGDLLAMEPPNADNPPFLGPAGTLHMTIADLVRWGQAHLKGERGQDGLLRAATFHRLHQPPRPDADYAFGWVVQKQDGRRVIWHNGSNTMWYAILMFDPEADRGVVLVTNGSIAAARALDAAAGDLLRAQ